MPANEKEPPKMLLDLPPEILEHILLRLDAPSFSVILMTCKAIRSNVLSSSKLIHSQLLRLPGLRVTPNHGVTEREEMLRTFCARASQHACNAVDIFCDTIVYAPLASTAQPSRSYSKASHLWTTPKLNLLQSSSSGLFSAAVDSDANIHIYKIHQGQVFPKFVLPANRVEIDYQCPSDQEYVRFSVAGLSFQKCHCSSGQPPHIIALYRYHIASAPPGQTQSFVANAIEWSKKRLKLVVWKFCQGELKVGTIRDVVLGSSSWADQPVYIVTSEYALRKTKSPPVSMVFQCLSGPDIAYHMRTFYYDRENDTNAQVGLTKPEDSFPNAESFQHLSFTKPIYKVRGRGGRELLFYTEDVVPSHRVADCTIDTIGIEAIPQTVSGDILNPVIGVYRGVPIDVSHLHHCGKLRDGSNYCINSLLQLVFPRNGTKAAYLLKGVESVDDCRHRSLDDDFSPLEHVFVAKLLGTDSPSTSPLKRIVAVSKCKKRIAIADWDVVKIYAIDPDAFFIKEKGSLSPGTSSTGLANCYKAFKSEEPIADDEAYTIRTAHGYYHSYLRIKGHQKRLVALEPTELPRRGVVYSMEFQGDSELWASTDSGLVKWYWGVGRTATRERRLLSPVHPDICI